MNNRLRIIDLRVTPGDSAYLLIDDQVSILYDTGFGFTGYRLADLVKRELGDRNLDYIFLTHSHYDHCLGTPYVKKRYPNAIVVAGEYTAEVFSRPHAISKMAELDSLHAKHYGIDEYEFLGDELKVDKVVKEGDTIKVGKHIFSVLEVAGHTKCSIAFFDVKDRLLLSAETLGIYHNKRVLPITLVGFEMSLDSVDKMLNLNPENILIPHMGEIQGEEAKLYLSIVKEEFYKARDYIVEGLKQRIPREELIVKFCKSFAGDDIEELYPPDAAHLNTSIMIALIEKEYAHLIN